MSNYSYKLLNSIRPLEVISSLNIQYTRDFDGSIFIKCPSCKSKLILQNSGLLCSSKACPTFVFSPIDLLMREREIKSYTEAVNTFVEMFPHKLNTVDLDISKIGSELHKYGQLIEVFLNSAREDGYTSSQTIARNYLRKQNVDPEAIPLMVFTLSKKQVNWIMQICRELGASGTINGDIADTPTIAIPHMADPHTITDIVLVRPNHRETQTITLNPRELSYSGLWQASANPEQIYLSGDYGAASSKATEFSKLSPEYMSLGTHYCAGADSIYRHYSNAIYIHRPEIVWDVNHIANLNNCLENLRISHNEQLLSWSDFLSCKISEVDWSMGMEIIDQAKLNKQTRAELIEKLRNKGSHQLINRVQNYCKNHLFQLAPDKEILEGGRGYIFRDEKSGIETDITNFLIELKNNVVFQDNLDICHKVDIIFQGKRKEALLPPAALHKPTELESYVRSSILSEHGTGKNLPTVLDPKSVTGVLRHLRSVAADSEEILGVKYLGWDTSRKFYYGPGWAVNENEVITNLAIHPQVDYQDYFDTQSTYRTHEKIDFSKCEMDLLSQILGLIVFTYLQQSVHPICYRNSPEDMAALLDVVAGLGQISPINLNTNMRGGGGSNYTNLFPTLTTGYNAQQAARAKMAAIMLLEDSGPIVNPGNKDMLYTGEVLRMAVIHLSQWLIKTKCRKLELTGAVTYPEKLSKIGAKAAQKCGFKKWALPEPKFHHLDSLLGSIAKKEVTSVFAYDAPSQIITFTPGEHGVNATDLYLECRALARKVEIDGKNMQMDAGSFAGICRNFYGFSPIGVVES